MKTNELSLVWMNKEKIFLVCENEESRQYCKELGLPNSLFVKDFDSFHSSFVKQCYKINKEITLCYPAELF